MCMNNGYVFVCDFGYDGTVSAFAMYFMTKRKPAFTKADVDFSYRLYVCTLYGLF